MNKNEDISIIGGSDGPTSVFITGGNHKPNLKQKLQKKHFELRKKWYALWIKTNPHTMEELFSLDYYYFEKQDKDLHMEIQLEARFEYIGGSTSGKRISKFRKIYKDMYKYYGVSEYDINNHTKRYENLLRTLALR